jgi:hypothetical protein
MKTFLLLTAISSAVAAFTTLSTDNYETTLIFMQNYFRTHGVSLVKALRLGA